MIIRIDENENETVVYRVRFFCWCFVVVSFYLSQVFELTGIPFIYRKIFKKNKARLLQWVVRFQKLWCQTEHYPAGTKIRISRSRLTIGYLRHIRGF